MVSQSGNVEAEQNIYLKLPRSLIKVNKPFDLIIQVIYKYGSLWEEKLLCILMIPFGTLNWNQGFIKGRRKNSNKNIKRDKIILVLTIY